ncbi:IS21 family transposase [Vibrio campbellii]|nr:IS21 family transposase [Vibrio campbellii]
MATLGASNYTYVEACESQRLEHWLEAHANAFEHFGGVPALLVPDNLKAAVTKTDRYEPQLNDSYRQLAYHYQTAVMPARPYKPKDKAKAENAVLIVERWIMMRLRNEVFHTFRELNLAIKELMQSLNQRRMKELDASRVESSCSTPWINLLYDLYQQNASCTQSSSKPRWGSTTISSISNITTPSRTSWLGSMFNYRPVANLSVSTTKVNVLLNTQQTQRCVAKVSTQSICQVTTNIRNGRRRGYRVGRQG